MELQSPYLEAIQAIPGSTPGQKFKELNLIARRIAAGTKAHGDTVPVIQTAQVPEALRPLVEVEIANVLRQPDGIVKALKSEDGAVVDRALRMNWFFRGDNEEVISIDYFERFILPYISLNTRIKLVKQLALNLRSSGKTKLAEDFYTYLARKYGRSKAETLFIACGKDFIYDTVTTEKIILSCRTVKNLFVKYPELVIRYLKLSKPREGAHDGHKVNIWQYNDFLPRLIKKHVNDFVELLEMHDSGLGVKLSNKSTETFLKNNIEVLLNKPSVYMPIMSLRVITAKLTKAQFRTMLAKMYPKRMEDFNYGLIHNYLEYYPEQERISLVMDLYAEVYKANLLDNQTAIGIEILCMLPADERARQARIKLEKEPDWRKNRYDPMKAWRCYLPIDESIPSIKMEITKSSSTDDRSVLLGQMLYTCKVNNDNDALLEALRYFTTRHKNEQIYVIFEVLDRLNEYFDLYTFGKDHWIVLNDFIKFLNVKDQFKSNFIVAKKILAASLYYGLVNDLPIDDKIAMIMMINLEGWNQSWSTLEKYPEYDRRCFDMFLSTIPLKYPQDNKIWKGRRCDIIDGIVKSMYEFNNRCIKANSKMEKLSIKTYPWLCEVLKNIIQSEPEEMRWQVQSIVKNIKTNEPELYIEWVPTAADEALGFENRQALVRLRDDPQNILDHWEAYLKNVKDSTSLAYALRFVKVSRWHQSIPIKFAERCLKDVVEKTSDCSDSLLVLGMLMEGSALARVIEPLVPNDSTIKIEGTEPIEDYRLMCAIPRAMRTTSSPVPLNLVLSFCDGEYLSLALVTLTNVCRRTCVEEIKQFTKTLVDRRVSVRKHGIRLFCLVASIDDIKIFLTDLWITETHRSIREVIFSKIYDLFVNEATPDTWTIMKECIDDLKIDDDDSVSQLVNMHKIPDHYFASYIKELLDMLEKLGAGGFSATCKVEHIARVISSIDETTINLLPEDFRRQLLRRYFCNPSVEKDINVSGIRYAINCYLRPDKPGLESRLSFFSTLYEDILKSQWDVPHPKYSTVYPINYFSHYFIDTLVSAWSNSINKITVLEAILASFLAVLKPEQDFVSYVLLTLSIAFKDASTEKDCAIRLGETLPRIVEALSPELVVEIASIVERLIKSRIDSDYPTDGMYRVIEALCDVNTVHSCMLAAKLLFCDATHALDDRHNKIVDFLRRVKNPAVVSLIYQHVNTCDFPE